ncbi:MAG: class I SAM-dependent methyltransferase, partial [Hyphomicrobiaceae bacterium]
MRTKQEAKDFISANIAAWDEVAPIHRQHNHARLLEEVRRADFCCLDEVERHRLQALDVSGKSLAQLCCNNGRELISVKKMGAARCVGFDAAQGFISDAQELAEAADCDVTFVCSDIHDISEDFHGNFDILTVTIGVLGWMPDLAEFFAVAARLLRPGGAFFIYEHHPILEMIKPGPAGGPLEWEISYFSGEAYVSSEGLDYYGGTDYGAKPAASFMHTMSSIVMAGLAAGFSIEHFEEFPHHISNTWWNVERAQIG